MILNESRTFQVQITCCHHQQHPLFETIECIIKNVNNCKDENNLHFLNYDLWQHEMNVNLLVFR